MAKKFVHTKIEKHPLRNAYLVRNTSCPFVPQFIGTLKECQQAQEHAERSAEAYIKAHSALYK